MKLNINTKYEGDFLSAEEFNLLVKAINNYSIGELSNVDESIDGSIDEDSVLVKDAITNNIILKKLSSIVKSGKDDYTLGELTNVDNSVDDNIDENSVLVKDAITNTFSLKKLADIHQTTLGELTNVDNTVDNDIEDDSVLIKYAGEDKFTLKRLSEITTPVIGLQRYVILQNNMPSKNVAVSKGDECNLNFTFVSQERYSSADKFQNTDERGLLEISIQNSTNAEFTVVKQMYINSAEPTKLNITEYLNNSTNTIMLKCKGEVSEEQTAALVYTVTVTTLSLSADNFRWWLPYTSNITIPFIIGGNINKKLTVTISGESYNQTYTEAIGTVTYTETPYNYSLPRPTNEGVYNITAYVSNTDGTLVTKTINYNVIVVELESPNKYVVVNNVTDSIINYQENTIFDYAVYDGDASTSDLTFTIELEGKQLYTTNLDKVPTQAKNTFSYQAEIDVTDSSSFNITTDISDSNNKLVEDIIIKVDNSNSFASVGGATFYLNPRTRSNAQSNKTKIVNEVNSEEYNATWTNFNWGNDAWQTDNEGNKILRIMSKEHLTIDYYPFQTEAARKGKTIEIDYLIDNVTDYSEPCITMCTDTDNYIGLRITPDNICLLSQSLKNKVTQATNTDTGKRIRLTVVIMPSAYGNADFNLCIIYINGKKNREFSYATNDYFAQNSPIKIGSNYADVDIYGIRMYDMALTSQQVLQNYINWLTDNKEKEEVRQDNDVLDITGTEVDFDNTIDQYNIMVFNNDLPSYLDPNKKSGTLELYFFDHPERNVKITNVSAAGQGTSSMKYFRWNTKYKLDKEKSVIYYADGTTGTKQWQMTPDIPAASVFTAKKNFASSMQSHKMGSVNSVDDLFKEMGLTNEAIDLDNTKRIAVYQLPFIMFTKSVNEEGEVIYTFAGEYTMGPDKGDENTFGFDTKKFPRLIALEGSDNSPLPALFRVPWTSRMQYNEDEEAFQYNGQNSWDFGAGEVENIDLWIPAYNLAYECSNRILPFEGTLDELNSDILTYRSSGYDYWIAKEGDTNQYNQYYYESSEGRFIPSNINLIEQLTNYIDTSNFNSLNAEAINNLFINARIAKFRDEAPNYYDITDAIFHRNWIEIHAGTDQRAKNTYPYCFGDGYKWKWRFDDTDTIFDTTNQGQPLKKYSVEVHDEGVWNGQTSNFWNLIDLAYPEEIYNEMHAMLNAMETLGGLNVGDDYSKLYAYFVKYYLNSSQYFPAIVINADSKYSYETAKLNPEYTNDTDPMTQALGDHYSAESAWISKRINYIMSKYSYGNFSANGNDTIIVRAAGDLINYSLTPAIDLYPCIANGTSIVRGNRTYAGNTTVMTIDLGGSADQQNIIQGASWYSSIGDWHDKNVQGTLTIQGQRLQELVLGSKTDDITIKIDSLEVKESCKSLQTILLSNITTLKGNLDVSNCTHLREIYADGTNLAQILLPKGSLEHIEYPDSNQYLALQNYPLLTYDNVVLGDSINNINDMIITSCPLIQPIRMLNDIIDKQELQGANHTLKRIRITDFDETFDATNGARLLDNLATITDGSYSGLDNNGVEIEGSYPTLEGTITVNCRCYEDSVELLRERFSNLIINVNGEYYIRFKDNQTKEYITSLFGDGTGTTRTDLANVKGGTYSGLWFRYSTDGLDSSLPHVGNTYRPLEKNYELGEYFDELKYFTNVKQVIFHNTQLKGVIYPPNVEACSGIRIAENGASVDYVKYMDSDTVSTLQIDPNYNTVNNVEVVYLPKRLNKIRDYFFRDISIIELYIGATTPPEILNWGWGNSVSAIKGKIYIPKGTLNAYETATHWSKFIGKYEEYDFDEDGRGIIPYMEYTKELTNLSASYKNGYLETVLTPKNALRDLVYKSDIDNFIKVNQSGNVTFSNFGTSQVKIYNKYKPELYSTVTLSAEKPTNGYYTYNAPSTFDTGVPLTLNTKMYMKFNNFHTSVMMGLCGTSWNSSNCMYFNSLSTTQIRFMNNGATTVNVTAGQPLEVFFENGKATINGTEYTLGVRTESFDGTIKLFNNGYAMSEPNFIGDLYEVKIWEGDELVRHYMPSADGTLVELQ